jgi:hypothetical protein
VLEITGARIHTVQFFQSCKITENAPTMLYVVRMQKQPQLNTRPYQVTC